MAILWTLLIFILCLWPSKELPEVNVPLADKWTHFVMFAVFSFLWLCVRPGRGIGFGASILVFSVLVGWFVEWLQLSLPTLGRSFDYNDIIANSIGGLLGVLLFYTASRVARKRSEGV